VTPPTAVFLTANAIHENYLKHCTVHRHRLWSSAGKMAARIKNRKKDLLTEEDISKLLDIKDESDVFCKESDDFWFDEGNVSLM
jgi:hypothetical protein